MVLVLAPWSVVSWYPWLTRSYLLKVVWCTVTGRECSGLLRSGGWMHAEVGPWIQLLHFTPFGSNRHNHGESYPFKVCLWKCYLSGLESWQGTGPAAPAGPTTPAGSAAPAWCASVIPFYPQMCSYKKKYQHKSWNFISIKNMHKTCDIPSSFPRYWRSETCCKYHQQTPPSWTFSHPRAKSRLGLGWSRVALMLLLCRFLCTIPYSCFEILLLLLFWRGGHASLSFFLCSLIGAHIFSISLLSIYFFFDNLYLLLQDYKKRNLFELWSNYFWWMAGMFYVTPSVGVSMYMWVYVISIMEAWKDSTKGHNNLTKLNGSQANICRGLCFDIDIWLW
jgi:hypothetical protein